MANNTPAPIPVPTDPEVAGLLVIGELIETVTTCFSDYAKCHEQEITERQRISACLAAATKQIEAKKAISMEICKFRVIKSTCTEFPVHLHG